MATLGDKCLRCKSPRLASVVADIRRAVAPAMVEATDDRQCSACGRLYALDPGGCPTPLCHPCAQEVLCEVVAAIRDVAPRSEVVSEPCAPDCILPDGHQEPCLSREEEAPRVGRWVYGGLEWECHCPSALPHHEPNARRCLICNTVRPPKEGPRVVDPDLRVTVRAICDDNDCGEGRCKLVPRIRAALDASPRCGNHILDCDYVCDLPVGHDGDHETHHGTIKWERDEPAAERGRWNSPEQESWWCNCMRWPLPASTVRCAACGLLRPPL